MPLSIPTANGLDCPPAAAPPATCVQGRAALLLVESLIHGLIARNALSIAEAIEVIETAADIEGLADRDAASAGAASPSLLAPLAASLAFDRAD